MRLLRPFVQLFHGLESRQGLIAVAAAIATTLIASWQIWETRKAAEAQTYLQMRQQFLAIAQKLDKYDAAEPLLRDTEQWKDLRRYWYVSFDEWYVTRKLGVFPDLWETYYAEAFVRALGKKNMRAMFCELRAGDFSTGIRKEFADTVVTTYREHNRGQSPCT
jgi:hypothetical protein